VGKSIIAASLGIELARRGCRVVLIDCDAGGADLDACLGIDAARPSHGRKMRFFRHFQSMAADFVILDLAAGTQKNTLDLFLLADHKLVVLVPEPNVVENAHHFVKAAFMRRLRAVCAIFGVVHLLDESLDGRDFRGPSEILEVIQGVDEETGRQIRVQMEAFRPGLVVNQVRTPEDAELGRRIAAAWRRYFGIEMDVLGAVEHDDDMWRDARERRPMLLARSECRAARSLARIAGRIGGANASTVLP
jgi:flagellar biosynthesis protein FlhG